MNRRRFLASAGSVVFSLGAIQAAPKASDRFAVSTWSFHNYFPNTRYGKPEFKLEAWDVKDVVKKVKETLGIRHFEMSSAHFPDLSNERLDDIAAFMKEQQCQFIHLSDNMKGVNLARKDVKELEGDILRFHQLIEVASRFKIPTMRVNTGTPEEPDYSLLRTIQLFKKLAGFAKEKGVEIIIENHFGISADPKKVIEIIDAVEANISSCPDFGLFKNEEERKAGLPLMFSRAKRICSAKFHGLDENDKSKDFDLKACYEVMKKAKFEGWISFEYEGNLEPLPQLVRMKALAEKWLA
jgi:sugar phosphate isomerase/epimerase